MTNSLCNAAVVIWLCVPATTIAADDGSQRPPFPVPDCEFGVLLTWITSASDSVEEREAFLQKASAFCEENESPAATAQAAILRELTREDQSLWGLRWRYTNLAAKAETPPIYAATAVYRVAALEEERGSILAATARLADARAYNPGGTVWVQRGDAWVEESVDEATQRDFIRLNDDRLPYRVTNWIADRIPLQGSWRFVAFLLLIFLLLRIMEWPIFLRWLPNVDRTLGRWTERIMPLPSGQTIYRGEADKDSILLRLLSADLWLIVEIITFALAARCSSTWVFVFDLGSQRGAGASSALLAGKWLFAGYMTAMFWYVTLLVFWPAAVVFASKRKISPVAIMTTMLIIELVASLAAVVLVDASAVPQWQALLLLLFCLTGFLITLGCRVVTYRRQRLAAPVTG